ncbi:hypothetical protein GCM10022254_31850 [Actinomadura meridiana]|uniref:Cation/H+ exchanger transmembrane domain-containing protein n=1 Tax=Actinomadura meridiana TaxID=559626 RepID=A0ABP8C210_9ACTN
MPVADPVAPIVPHHLLVLLLQLGVLLMLAALLGRLARKCGMPAIVGELCAGALAGPSVLGALSPDLSGWLFPADGAQTHLLDAVGQVGLLLLVGLTGMELDFGLVRRRGRVAAQISAAGFVLPLVLGVGLGLLLPASLLQEGADRTAFVLFLGVAMSVSAIPVIAKTLFDLKLVHRNVGQLILAAGVVDDVAGWLMLSVVSALATSGLQTGDLGRSLICLGAVVVFALVLGRPTIRLVMRSCGGRPGEHPAGQLAVAVALIVLAAAGTHAMGLEAVFGAFVCGIVMRASGAVDPAVLAPLRGVVLAVLAPIYFATAGLRMDLTALVRPSVLLAAVAVLVVAIVGKFAGAFLGSLAARYGPWEALAIGAGMNARGVIEVIVAMAGLRLGVLSTEAYTIIVLVALVTSVMAPPLLRVAMGRVEQTAEEALRRRDDDPFRHVEEAT